MGFLDIVDGPGQPGHPTGTDAVIGYIVRPGAAGQGIGTATARALLQAAFDGLGLRRVTAAANADNAASMRVLERVGMRRERVSRSALWHRQLGLGGRGWLRASQRRVDCDSVTPSPAISAAHSGHPATSLSAAVGAEHPRYQHRGSRQSGGQRRHHHLHARGPPSPVATTPRCGTVLQRRTGPTLGSCRDPGSSCDPGGTLGLKP